MSRPHLNSEINSRKARHCYIRYQEIGNVRLGGSQRLEWPCEKSGRVAIQIEYGGEGGRDYLFIVNNENAWSWAGNHIRPLSSTFSVNGKSAGKQKTLDWRLDNFTGPQTPGGYVKLVSPSPYSADCSI
jgi:hypothetical protein